MSTSDTPRCDEMEMHSADRGIPLFVVCAEFAGQLERELTRLTAANKALVEALETIAEETDHRNCRGHAKKALKEYDAAKTTQDKGTM